TPAAPAPARVCGSERVDQRLRPWPRGARGPRGGPLGRPASLLDRRFQRRRARDPRARRGARRRRAPLRRGRARIQRALRPSRSRRPPHGGGHLRPPGRGFRGRARQSPPHPQTGGHRAPRPSLRQPPPRRWRAWAATTPASQDIWSPSFRKADLTLCRAYATRRPMSPLCALLAATQLTVFAASSLRDAFLELGRRFEAEHPGVAVSFNFAGSQELRTQIEHGARADVLASADERHLRALAEAGLAEAPRSFARNEPVIVVPSGNPAAIHDLRE